MSITGAHLADVFEACWRDVRFAMRRIRRDPSTCAIVVLTLALSIGANTTLFGLVRAIVDRPLPVRAPDQLVLITLLNPKNAQQLFTYLPTFDRVRSEQHVFESMSLYAGGGILRGEVRGVGFDGGVETATGGFFESLGVRPYLGRFPTALENPSSGHAAPYVVISYRTWQRYFSADPHAIAETIRVEGIPLNVIGIAPAEFHGLYVDGGTDFWVSMDFVRTIAGDPSKPLRSRTIVARLRSGVPIEQARAELSTLLPSVLSETLPSGVGDTERRNLLHGRVNVEPFANGFSTLRKKYGNPLEALTLLASLLLAIGCTNLSGLFLARLVARDREIATQLALGASRAAVVRQAAVEVLLLSSVGGAAAVWLASKGSAAIVRFVWNSGIEPLALSARPDGMVLTIAVAVAIAAGLLVGILPAWLATRREWGLSASSSRANVSPSRTGRGFVGAQIALSLVLLTCAGLFVQTLRNLRANDAAFPAREIVLSRLWLKPGVARTLELTSSYYRDLLGRLSTVPGVQAASFAATFPGGFQIQLSEQPTARADDSSPNTEIDAATDSLSPGFFDTLGIVRLAGRDFTWQDDPHSRSVVILNTVLATRLFPDGNAIGRRLRIGGGASASVCEVIGIVADAPVYGIRVRHVPMAFRPLLQTPSPVPVAIVRARGNVDPVIAGYKSALAAAPYHFLREVETLDDLVNQALQQERLAAWGGSLFAGLALVLCALGVYGLVAHSAARRTREIGVRMALGARRTSILWMMLRQGLWPATVGAAIGLCAAAFVGRLARSMLYGITPFDPITLASAAAGLAIIAVAAALPAAYHAASSDPMVALRSE